MQMCSLLFTRTFWGKRFQWCVCLCLDYIAAAGSQEDDIHNVQSVIDSLSLDYLQISLSHITGENVIRGDKDSIKNLLEIFDGLLEYLKEEMIEESQNDGIAALRNSTVTEEPEQSSSSIGE
ncbi:centrosomal protein of 95 kDa-like isoform X2 [Takifugu rubripes]|nr:centrosomal protein of 95 kDa-like isoform X2 [Takifugu rubripes]